MLLIYVKIYLSTKIQYNIPIIKSFDNKNRMKTTRIVNEIAYNTCKNCLLLCLDGKKMALLKVRSKRIKIYEHDDKVSYIQLIKSENSLKAIYET